MTQNIVELHNSATKKYGKIQKMFGKNPLSKIIREYVNLLKDMVDEVGEDVLDNDERLKNLKSVIIASLAETRFYKGCESSDNSFIIQAKNDLDIVLELNKDIKENRRWNDIAKKINTYIETNKIK
jgi:hypothetical protein